MESIMRWWSELTFNLIAFDLTLRRTEDSSWPVTRIVGQFFWCDEHFDIIVLLIKLILGKVKFAELPEKIKVALSVSIETWSLFKHCMLYDWQMSWLWHVPRLSRDLPTRLSQTRWYGWFVSHFFVKRIWSRCYSSHLLFFRRAWNWDVHNYILSHLISIMKHFLEHTMYKKHGKSKKIRDHLLSIVYLRIWLWNFLRHSRKIPMRLANGHSWWNFPGKFRLRVQDSRISRFLYNTTQQSWSIHLIFSQSLR